MIGLVLRLLIPAALIGGGWFVARWAATRILDHIYDEVGAALSDWRRWENDDRDGLSLREVGRRILAEHKEGAK